jgi:hypothetical protein
MPTPPMSRLLSDWPARTACVLALAVAPVLLASVSGCGPSRPRRVPVSGKVLIDGQPLSTGYVQVIPHGARASFGEIQPDGSFRLTCYTPNDGVVPGTHRVVVSSTTRINETHQRWNVPRRYADPMNTDLTVTIDKPTDSLVLELTWGGEQPEVEYTGVIVDD